MDDRRRAPPSVCLHPEEPRQRRDILPTRVVCVDVLKHRRLRAGHPVNQDTSVAGGSVSASPLVRTPTCRPRLCARGCVRRRAAQPVSRATHRSCVMCPTIRYCGVTMEFGMNLLYLGRIWTLRRSSLPVLSVYTSGSSRRAKWTMRLSLAGIGSKAMASCDLRT